MMKWLRKHTKHIMVVVVLLAMLSFVGGSALQGIVSPNRGTQPFARAFGEEITYDDHLIAQKNTDVLERLRLSWQYDPSREMLVDHWYLLATEAERAGIRVSDKEVENALQLRQQALIGWNFPADYLDRLRSQNITIVDIRRALRRHLTILKNFQRAHSASIPSEAQIRHYVRDTEDKIRVRYVALDAEKFVDPDEPLAEEDLQALFEKHKDVLVADSETGRGYKYPQRVKVQYIHTSLEEIEPAIKVTIDEAKAYWKKNKAKYRKIEFVDAPAPTTTSATQPVTPRKISKQVQKSFSESRLDIERDIRQTKARQRAGLAMKKVVAALSAPWEGQPTDPGTGFKAIPAEVMDPDFLRSVSQSVAERIGIPLSYGETGLETQAELAAIKELEKVFTLGEDNQPLTLAECAFRCAPFLEDQRRPGRSLRLQLYETPDAALSDGGTVYYSYASDGRNRIERPKNHWAIFRVIEAHLAEAPKTLDEVRSDVERDLRLVRTFDRIKAVAEEFHAVSSILGVGPALELLEDLRNKSGIQNAVSPPAFARRMSILKMGDQEAYDAALRTGESPLTAPKVADVGSEEAFVDACFEMTQEGWKPAPVTILPTTHIETATTQPTVTPAPVVRLLPLAKQNRWYIVELLGTESVDSEKFQDRHRRNAYNTLKSEREYANWLSWFAPESITARCGFERIETAPPVGADEGIEATEEERPQPLRL